MSEDVFYKVTTNFIIDRHSKKMMNDICFGAYISYSLERADVGQSVVVRNKTIMAVESFEGREETIERGCNLSNGKSCVIIMNKLSSSDSGKIVIDINFLLLLQRNNVELLALEENILIKNMANFIKEAKHLNITLFFFNREYVFKFMSKEG